MSGLKIECEHLKPDIRCFCQSLLKLMSFVQSLIALLVETITLKLAVSRLVMYAIRNRGESTLVVGRGPSPTVAI